uniref:PAS domain-containing protein n=1 Tax=Brucella intermedia TaxID=94625 RepID=UPI0012D34DFF
MTEQNADKPRQLLIPSPLGSRDSENQTRLYSAFDARDWLAAVVDGSQDAIISKDLNGVIQTWNGGAQRLFGYHADEIVGQPVTILIPDSRLHEEAEILAQIRAGNRVEHFETLRRKKDGSLVEISLTISPIRDMAGAIVGASKIARDITERCKAQEQQRLLIGEMHHRIKNLFALAGAIVSLSEQEAETASELRQQAYARLSSLARVHDLTMPDLEKETAVSVSFQTLLRTILEPFDTGKRGGSVCLNSFGRLVKWISA